MKKIAVFLAPGFEEIEALTAVDYLRRAGADVVTVSVPEDGCPKIEKIVTGSHNIPVTADMLLKDFIDTLNIDLLDAIYLPGGLKGSKNLAENQFIFQLITKMERKGKIVAGVCATPAVVFAPTAILSGRNWTCYPGMENELSDYCGSETRAKALVENSRHIPDVPYVFDNNLLTGRGPGTTEQVVMKFIELLCGESVAKKIHDGTCQR